MPTAPPDLGTLSRVVADAIAARVAERLVAAGFDDVRDPQRGVVEGLVAGDATVTQLAARLGVSAQAVSKTVTELERSGYVRRGQPRRRPAGAPAAVHATRRRAGRRLTAGPGGGGPRARPVARHP